jgi:hypothetical protein
MDTDKMPTEWIAMLAFKTRKVTALSGTVIQTLAALTAAMLLASVSAAKDFFVSSSGSDANPGTESSPFATVGRAQDAIRALPHPIAENVTVSIGSGTYSPS